MFATASGWVMYGSPERRNWVGVPFLGHLVGPLQHRQVGLRMDLPVHRDQRLEHRVDSAALGGHPRAPAGRGPAATRWSGLGAGTEPRAALEGTWTAEPVPLSSVSCHLRSLRYSEDIAKTAASC